MQVRSAIASLHFLLHASSAELSHAPTISVYVGANNRRHAVAAKKRAATVLTIFNRISLQISRATGIERAIEGRPRIVKRLQKITY